LLDANKYEVLSFDCYGTLVDWESGIISGLRPVLRGHGVEATDDEILALHAQTEHKLQAASKRGGYVKYRDMLAEEVREAGRRRAGGGVSSQALRRWRRFPTP
jgi:2-haloacid dehalogenase